MKKPIVTTLLLLVITTVYGQDYLSKGSNLIDASLMVDIQNNEVEDNSDLDTKNRNYSIRAGYGKFIKDNLVVGGSLRYTNLNRKLDQDIGPNYLESNANRYGGGVFIRKYWPIYPKFGVYGQSGLGYSFTSYMENQDSTAKRELRTNTFGLDASIGFYYFVFDRLSLNLNLGQINLFTSKTENLTDDVTERTENQFKIDLVNTISFDDLIHINFYF